jgi:hypothetical protein
MADSNGTDAAFGFILFLLFLALLGYAAGGVAGGTGGSGSGTTPRYPTPTGKSVTSCTSGIAQQPVSKTGPSSTPGVDAKITLTVYVDGDRKCAIAERSPADTEGTLVVTLAYTNAPTIGKSSMSDTDPVVGVQVDGTDNLCVSAFARLTRGTTEISVTSANVAKPCDLAPAKMSPGLPGNGPVVMPTFDDKEDEEGY